MYLNYTQFGRLTRIAKLAMVRRDKYPNCAADDDDGVELNGVNGDKFTFMSWQQ